ncbi:MAG: RAD55 family ATPase [Candidatus Bilamarchaeum sp.]
MAKKKPSSTKIERIPSGIPGLDQMIGGGFVRNSTTLLQGGAGAAKTLLCLQHLYHGATEMEETGIFLSFNESEKALLQHGMAFGWDFKALIEKKKFAVVSFEPHEIVRIINEGSNVLQDSIESLGAKRLVVDSLSAYNLYFEKPYQANQSILSLFEQLRKTDVTTLLTMENTVTPNRGTGDRAEFLTDGVLNLYNIRKNRQNHRAIEVIKMRDTNHSNEIKLFSVEKTGLRVINGPKLDV